MTEAKNKLLWVIACVVAIAGLSVHIAGKNLYLYAWFGQQGYYIADAVGALSYILFGYLIALTTTIYYLKATGAFLTSLGVSNLLDELFFDPEHLGANEAVFFFVALAAFIFHLIFRKPLN